MRFGLRVHDLGRSISLRPTLHYPRLADAMAAFEKGAPEPCTQATITEYGDSSQILRIVCVGRPEGGQVVWDMPASPWHLMVFGRIYGPIVPCPCGQGTAMPYRLEDDQALSGAGPFDSGVEIDCQTCDPGFQTWPPMARASKLRAPKTAERRDAVN